MRKGVIFIIDALFASVIVVLILLLINNENDNYSVEKVLHNMASSSLMTLKDELASEDENAILVSLNKSIISDVKYNIFIVYYEKDLSIRKSLVLGYNMTDDVIVSRNLFWTDEGPGKAVLRVWYDE